MPTLPAKELERVTRDIFTAWGTPPDDAAWVATLLVRANLRGHDSHGVIRVPGYVAAIEKGDVNPRAKIASISFIETTSSITGTSEAAWWVD